MVIVTIPVATVISCLVESPRKSKACLRQSGGIGGTGGTGGMGGAAGMSGRGGAAPGGAGGTGVDGDDICLLIPPLRKTEWSGETGGRRATFRLLNPHKLFRSQLNPASRYQRCT